MEGISSRAEAERVEVIHNEKNLGFPAGCNQALAKARGQYLVFLNNDTIVTSSWLENLIAWSLHDWPNVGMVGPVTNYSRPPQQISVDYEDVRDLEAFAARRREQFARQAMQVERLTGFCLLTRRDVVDRIGNLDEQYGVGFFDDDDLSVRALTAGYKLLIALNIFIHHFGSRTFTGLSIDCPRQLAENFERFKAKWGPVHAAGYRGDTKTRRGSDAGMNEGVPGRPEAAAKSMTDVALCMIVKNEEQNLGDCLTSAAGLFAETVIIDTGSTDRTKEIATEFGATVVDFPWIDSFAAARNESIRHATCPWIFWLDADDRLDEENRTKLRELFATLQDENVAFVMKCHCLPDSKTGTATLVDHVRLFRSHPEILWEHRVHEQILPAIRRLGGSVRWADILIHHAGYLQEDVHGRKKGRNLRLLQMEYAEQPDHPFTLFNLGSAYEELGHYEQALPYFWRSLELSAPTDSIVRKLYSSCVQCHRALKQWPKALEACRAGRKLYPADAELLFLEGILCEESGDVAGAERCWLDLLESREGPHFSSLDSGIRGYKTRHNLATIYLRQGRVDDAEAQCRFSLSERPDFKLAWVVLGDIALHRGTWGELEDACRNLDQLPDSKLEAGVLRARSYAARKDFRSARALLEELIAREPDAVFPRIVLSHVLLEEGQDWDAAEPALRDVLALDPENAGAQNNLRILLEQRGNVNGMARLPSLAEWYGQVCSTPSDINEHCPTLYHLARQCRHITEMGTRTGVSTVALLFAQPDKLICYDRARYPQLDLLGSLAGRTQFVFQQADVLDVQIEETDLLFIDTWHVYDQLQKELRLHAGKVRKYIVLHDTTQFAEQGETTGYRGLWPAVEEFLAQKTFRIKKRYSNNNGLTVLERIS